MQTATLQAAPAQVGRLLYRAKQRGFLEMDLLVGLWAQANLPAMDAAQLSAFEVPAADILPCMHARACRGLSQVHMSSARMPASCPAAS
jgi:hypothetical protein